MLLLGSRRWFADGMDVDATMEQSPVREGPFRRNRVHLSLYYEYCAIPLGKGRSLRHIPSSRVYVFGNLESANPRLYTEPLIQPFEVPVLLCR